MIEAGQRGGQAVGKRKLCVRIADCDDAPSAGEASADRSLSPIPIVPSSTAAVTRESTYLELDQRSVKTDPRVLTIPRCIVVGGRNGLDRVVGVGFVQVPGRKCPAQPLRTSDCDFAGAKHIAPCSGAPVPVDERP